MRRLARAGVGVVAALALTLGACGGGDGGAAGTKEEWEEEHGDLVAAYSRDLTDALNSVNQGERQTTLGTCTQVADDAKEVKDKALPVPNPDVEAPLRRAVDLGAQAADDCLRGGRNTDARAVEAAQREFTEARRAMDEAEAAIKSWK